MKVNLSLEEIKKILKTGEYKNIPISTEILSDVKTPIETLKILKNISTNVFILESAGQNETWGRYTFLGYDPKMEISAKGNHLKIKASAEIEIETDRPSDYIRKIIADNKSPRLEGLPPLTGGLVGYFSYDYIKYAEKKLILDAKDSEGFKDMDLMLFDKIIAYDNYKQKIILIVNIRTEDIEVEYNRGISELEALQKLILEGKPKEDEKGILQSEFTYLFNKEEYCNMVERAKDYIYEGDIFQVVLSNRMEAEFTGSLLDTYRFLRASNPSPYMFYFYSKDIELAGASPETLVKLENTDLYTYPLAGTRKRGRTQAEDMTLEKELLSDEKERAEHNMLVDLGRNDLGKISKFGSVEVEKYMQIEKFSQVMHIGSTVKGSIRPDRDALDAIESVLPAGTLSGAPKIRAVEIINELEKDKRGIYGGAIGYIDFTGNMDTCIAIRLAFKKNGKIMVRSGAGIVADSIPENEYMECINKAKAVVKAIKEGEKI